MQYRDNVGVPKVFSGILPNRMLPNILALAFAAVALTGCGGGGGDAPSLPAPPQFGTPPPGALPPPGQPVTWVDPLQRQDVISPYWPAGGQHALAFDRLNEIRGSLGLGLLRQDTRLDQAAQGHAVWLQQNMMSGHFQTPDPTWFTGVTPIDRARAAGYPLDVIEVATTGGLTLQQTARGGEIAVNFLLQSPTHRSAIFRFRLDDAGIGFASNMDGTSKSFVTKLGQNPGQGAPGLDFVVWPRNGVIDVVRRPGRFVTPDPNEGRPFGYPVSIHTHENRILEVDRFQVRDMSGNVILTHLLDRTTWAGFEGQTHVAAVIGRDPWPPNTVLVAEFRGRIDGREVGHTWNFTTGQ